MDRFSIDRKNGDFVMIYKHPFRDEGLSLKARGLLATIMAFPPEWEFSIKGLTKVIKEGKSAVYTTINELIDKGYCNRVTRRDEGGTILGVDYTFAEYPKFPIPDTSTPFPENPDTENQYPENRTQYNILKNERIKEDRDAVLADKREKFRKACEKYVPKYGREMVDDFIRYWSEAESDTSVLLKCEVARKKTGCFEIGGRIATWASKPYNQHREPIVSAVPTAPKKTKWDEMGLTEEEYNQLIYKK